MSSEPRRLLLLINSLEGGGAENIMAYLANALANTLHDVEIRLALLDDLPRCHTIDPRVKIEQLDCRGSFRRSIFQTRKLISDWRPDVVLSFLTRANCASILARRSVDFRCIVSERVNTSTHLGTGMRARVLRKLIAWLYPKADTVVAVSQGVRHDLIDHHGLPADRVAVIHNPVDQEKLLATAAESSPIDLPEDYFVNVGRLVPNKGGHSLLRAFAKHRNTSRALVILGEGPERAALGQLAKDLGIFDRVKMPGYMPNPHAIVSRATAYVAASRSEGFPNAMIEAMALGTAVAATDCHSGPAEILEGDGEGQVHALKTAKWGLLTPVDDVDAMAAAMDLLDDRDIQHMFRARAKRRAGEYSPAKAIARYVEVLGLANNFRDHDAPYANESRIGA